MSIALGLAELQPAKSPVKQPVAKFPACVRFRPIAKRANYLVVNIFRCFKSTQLATVLIVKCLLTNIECDY